MPARAELRADGRDGPLTGVVQVRESASLGSVHERGVDHDASPFELGLRATPELARAEHDEERDRIGELRQLHRGDGTASRRLLPRLSGVDDLAGRGDVLDPHELHHLHVSDDGSAHPRHAHKSAAACVS